MSDVVVRRGRSDDIDAAIAVYLASNEARRNGQPTSLQMIERVRIILHGSDAFLVVAEDAGVVVGMGSAMQGLADDGEGPPMPGVCFISMVYVAPDHWGQGIGGQIVEALLVEATSRGYDRAQLWTQLDNHRAQRLYERLRFWRTGREKDNDLGDRIVLYEREC